MEEKWKAMWEEGNSYGKWTVDKIRMRPRDAIAEIKRLQEEIDKLKEAEAVGTPTLSQDK